MDVYFVLLQGEVKAAYEDTSNTRQHKLKVGTKEKKNEDRDVKWIQEWGETAYQEDVWATNLAPNLQQLMWKRKNHIITQLAMLKK